MRLFQNKIDYFKHIFHSSELRDAGLRDGDVGILL